MDTRVPLQAENGLVTELKSLRTDVDGLKVTQPVGGSNVQGYLSGGDTYYDLTFTLAVGGTYKCRLDFWAPGATYVPLADLYLLYATNPNVLTYAIPPYANGPVVSMYVEDAPLNGYTAQWYAYFVNNSGSSQTVYVKPVFNTSSLGVFQFFVVTG